MRQLFGGILLILSILSCSKSEDEPGKEIRERFGVLMFDAGPNFSNKKVPLHYFIAGGTNDHTAFQLVMHGANRNAGDYLAAWTPKARQYGLIVVAPEFSAEDFSNAQYNEGNFIQSGNINPPEATTFALMDQIFAFVQAELNLQADRYNIFGHSAGAQFVHRYLQFYDSDLLDKAVAANAGWYTFPNPSISYPYGIRNLFGEVSAHQSAFFEKDLCVLLGTDDTNRDNNLRVTTQADNQGLNRFERGNNFYTFCNEKAVELNAVFKWQLVYVDGVAHEYRLMSGAAADFLYGQ